LVGWEPDCIGRAVVGADLASPAGYALKTGRPVISNHLENETRFRTPELMASHGIRRAVLRALTLDRATEQVGKALHEGDVGGAEHALAGVVPSSPTTWRTRRAFARRN
jgi:hypothetical protein